jgi:O-antigen/teichoic acid export membrane protein
MSDNGAFKAVAKGGGIGFIGMVASALIQFTVGVLIIRLLSKEEFGLISLAYVIVNILAMISSLGMVNGVPRFLAKCRATDADYDFSGIASAALSISFVTSLFVSLLFFLSAETIATLLSKPGLAYVVRVFSVMIPAVVLISILTAIFRGIGQVKPKLMFQDVLPNTLRLVFVLFVAVIGQHYVGVIFAYVGSLLVAAILYFTYARERLAGKLSFNLKPDGVNELLVFSFSLLGLSLIVLLMAQVAALVLGYLKPAEQVALYSAPLRLATMLQIPLQAMSFLYLPYATGLFASGKQHELQALYLRVTKWTCYVAMPVFLAFLFDPDFIVVLLFGAKYVDSAPILQVLAVGFFFNTLVGLNGQTLMSFGRTKEIIIATTSGLSINVILGILLVPGYGALGSAFSVAGGLFISNVIMSAYLVQRYGIKPIGWPYFRALLLAFLLVMGLHFLMGNALMSMDFVAHAIFILLLSVACVFSPFLAKSVDDKDIALLSSLEQLFFHTNKLTIILGHSNLKRLII